MAKRLLKSAISLLAMTMAIGTAERAGASGFQLFDQSPSGQGNAFAGAGAVAEDASTVFFNPAGMTYLNGYQTVAGLQIITPTGVLSPSTARTAPTAIGGPSMALTGQGSRDLSETAVVPNFYFVAPFGEDFRAGLGVSVPFGLVTDYGSNSWVGRYYATRSDLKTIDVNPSVAYKATKWLSLGAGMDVIHAHALLKNAVDFGTICANAAGTATCGLFGLSPQANDGQAALEANDTTVSWNAGAIVQPLEHTRIGLTYRSSYDLHLDGTASFTVPGAFRTLQTAVPAFGGTFLTGGAHAKITLPQTASVAVYQDIDAKWAVMGDVTWTNWSSFQNLIVTFDNPSQPASVTAEKWHDTFRSALGVIFAPNDRSKLRFGVAYDPTPVKSAFRTLRIPDDDRIWLSIGYNLRLLENLSLDAAYTHIFIPGNSPVNLSNASFGTVVGTYDSAVNIFALGLKYTF